MLTTSIEPSHGSVAHLENIKFGVSILVKLSESASPENSSIKLLIVLEPVRIAEQVAVRVDVCINNIEISSPLGNHEL